MTNLKERLGEISDLNSARAVLSWDQETYMPAGGAEFRAMQIGTLEKLAHELFTSDETGEMLEASEKSASSLDPDSDDARLLKVTRRDYDQARKLPSSLVADLARTISLGRHDWVQARNTGDFPRFRPHLEKIVDLSIQKAEALGYVDTPYDALVDLYEPGMRTAKLREVFKHLANELVPIVRAIAEHEPPADGFLHAHYDEKKQWDFGLEVLRDIGFDLERGRQDVSAHPFTTTFSVHDVRLTTRLKTDNLPTALFGTIHEGGHGLYEQNIDPALARTPLADGTSLGMHESQSMLWENIVGHSRVFWQHYYPRLQAVFPEQLREVDLGQFYRAINRVQPSLIRVEADEVTYNLHIILRFELETALIERKLKVEDLPEAWNAKMQEYLGLTPPHDGVGVLQDIHWAEGLIGYFPTYALGKLTAAQLFDRAKEQIPDLDRQIGAGNFQELLDWLRHNVHRHGRKFTAGELLTRITGRELSAEPWLSYIQARYREIYGI